VPTSPRPRHRLPQDERERRCYSGKMREKFGRYEVQAEIGDGAMGRVFRAFDPLARRTVAVKTVKVELLAKDSSEEYLRRFRREAQAAGGLSHPSIVTIYDVGEDFFVMEHLEGKSLQELLKERGRLDLPSAIEILRPIADALDFAHSRGVIHRDIKPANIMVAPDGRPKLMDFGVAHIESTVMTATGQFLGSPSYMAPEQIGGAELTNRADLFSLATVAYEMLTGQRAFEGKTVTTTIFKVMNSVPEPPRSLNGELPHHCDDVFARALSKDAALRFESARAFVAALDLKQLDESLVDAFDTLTAGATSAAAEASATPPTVAGEPDTVEIKGAKAAMAAKLAAVAKPDPQQAPAAPEKRTNRATVLGLAAALLVAAAVGAWWWRGQKGEGLPEPQASLASTATPAPPESAPAPTAEPSPEATPLAPEPSPSATPAAAPTAAPTRTARKAKAPEPPAATPTPTPAPVREGDLVELTPDVTPPKRVRGPSVNLPDAARRKRLTGTVGVRMIVTEKGEPVDFEVVESAGDVLDQAVLRAVRQFRFEPAVKDGIKVRVSHTIRFTFRSE
jgi:eukaryotic-like serine/threonine-protein kinase